MHFINCVASTEGVSDVTSTPAFALSGHEGEPYYPDGTSWMTDKMIADAWKTEPLSQVDLSLTRKERSEVEVRKLMRVIYKYTHLISDGHLDFSSDRIIKHNTTCKITTTVPEPHIQSTNRSAAPKDRELYKKIIKERLKEGVIEKSCAPWSSNSILVKKMAKCEW